VTTKQTAELLVVGFVLFALILNACEDCIQTPPTTAPAAATPPSPLPDATLSVDCRGVLEDAAILEKLHRQAQSLRYRLSRDTCQNITTLVEARFDATWSTKRRVPPRRVPGEPPTADAARTLHMSGVAILLQLVCDGPAKLRREFGPDIVRDYERDLTQFIARVRETCAR